LLRFPTSASARAAQSCAGFQRTDEAASMTGKTITLKTADGAEIGAYRAEPAGAPRGGLVVIQEAFGVNDYVRSVVERYAAEGYTSIAPMIYDRQERGVELGYEGDDLARARELRRGLQWNLIMADVAASIDAVSTSGKVGIIGYCVGGSVAWLAAQRLPVAAAVSYYGRDIVDLLEPKPACPVMLHYAETDHHIPLADVETVRAAYPAVPLYIYPGEHGFDCDLRANFHPESASVARQRSAAFLERHIG
jgi:carboxymethylenebutenolidase